MGHGDLPILDFVVLGYTCDARIACELLILIKLSCFTLRRGRSVKALGIVRSIRTASVAGLLIFAGCASAPVDQIELMPAPDVYGDGLLNPLPEANPFERIPYDGILFATDRAPAGADDPEQYYQNERGYLLRLGLAEIQFGKKEFQWDFARQVSMLKSRSSEFPVKISSVEEWGMLESSVPSWFDMNLVSEEETPPDASD